MIISIFQVPHPLMIKSKILIFSNLAPIFFENIFMVIYITQPCDLALK